MVAIVSGNSLGLNLTSKGALGNQGVNGNPSLGSGNEQVYVDVSNGNLVLQQRQDELVGPGLDIDSVLTYNSQGLANDDNGDNFSLGKYGSQLVQTSIVNTAGSTVTVTDFDGSKAVYNWDAANSRYITTSGGGAYDVITYTSPLYTLTDGTTRQTSTYDGTTGRLLTRADTTGHTLTYGYDATSGQLTSVTSSDGEVVRYVYSGNQLTQISAPITMGDGVVGFSTQTAAYESYTYDASNRLTGVAIRLSSDNGNAYTTTYTYDGTSKRVQSVSESGGTKLTFAYDTSMRISTVTDGLGNVTSYTYDTVNRKTSVKANGQTTVYAYDTLGQLTSVTTPPVGGVSMVASYVYDTSGNVTSVTDGAGRKFAFTYDGAGNQLTQTDGLGLQTVRTFDSQNHLLTETTSTLATPSLGSSGAATINGGTVQKTGSTAAWDAAVRSAIGITGAATVSFTANATTGDLAIGLNSDPITDASYTSLDYALRLTNGSLFAYSNGTQVQALGTFAIGDSLSVSYDGAGHIQYWKNGASLYTQAATPTLALYVDSSFYTANISVSQLAFGAGSVPSQTTRYIYRDDSKGVLRFSISASGRVAEYNYDGAPNDGLVNHINEYVNATYNVATLASNEVPTYATMVAWHGTQDLSQTERTDISRDARGQVASSVSYVKTATDGTGINDPATTMPTYYAFDAAGNMVWKNLAPTARLQKFDSLGRLTYVGDEQDVITNFGYPAQFNHSSVAYANGLTRYQEYDAAGNLTAVDDSSRVAVPYDLNGTSNYHYDAVGHLESGNDPQGYENWALYDAAGRKVADIDADGRMTEYVYDKSNLVTETIRYKAPVMNMAALGNPNGTPLNPDISTMRPVPDATVDQRNWNVYDKAGRLVQTIDSLGAVTQFTYDGAGHLTATTRFATLINPSSLTGTPAAVSVSPTTADRTTRAYYDADGNTIGTLDPNGYLTEYQYNGAGKRTVSIRYATKSPASAPLTLARARPAASPADQRTVSLYDMTGRVTGQVDPQGYLTETVYNASNQVDHTVRYATAVGTTVAAGAAVAAVRPATSAADRVTTNVFNALGQLASQKDPDGIVTAYTYDAATGALLSTTTGSGRPDASTVQRRYDIYGRVMAELDGNASATIPANATQAQIDAVWAAKGISYTYDALGDLLSMKDALGNITYNYYDGHGRLLYTVNAQGAVTQNIYDALGEVTGTIKYATAISTSGLAAGRWYTSTVATAVRAIADSGKDHATRNVYDADGHLTLHVDSTGAAAQYKYDAFGEVVQTLKFPIPIPVGHALRLTRYYTMQATAQVGLGTFNAGDVVSVSVNVQLPANYTATASLNSPVATAQPFSINSANGPTIQWTTLTFTATISTTGTYTLQLLGNSGVTGVAAKDGDTIVYDDLKVSSTQRGVIENESFDSITTGAGIGQWQYAGVINPNSIFDDTDTNLLVEINSLNPAASVSVDRTVYDNDGRIALDVDPMGLATSFTYNANGNVTLERQYAKAVAVSAVKGNTDSSLLALVATQADAVNDRIVRTVYDADQRRTLGVDSTGTVTTYTYDANSNVTLERQYAKRLAAGLWTVDTDAQLAALLPSLADATNDRVARNVYDDAGQRVLSLTPTGGATSYTYDARGNVTQVKQFWTPTPASGAAAYTDAQLVTLVTTTQANAANDRISIAVYDLDGRITLSVDGNGAATSFVYDLDGNLKSETHYAKLIASGASRTTAPAADAINDRTTTYTYDSLNRRTAASGPVAGAVIRYAYDALDRLVYTVAGDGAVVRNDYDAQGRVIRSTEFAAKLTAANLSSLSLTAQPSQIAALVVASPGFDAISATVYDGFGRAQFTMDGAGAVSELRYDLDGNVTDAITYANPIAVSAWVAGRPPVVTADASRDVHVRTTYNTFGQAIAQADGTGALTVNTYDLAGRLATRTIYANRIAVSSWPATGIPSDLVADPARDIQTRFEYNAFGQIAFEADGTGATMAFAYDVDGNLSSRTALFNRATAGTPLASIAANPADRAERFEYNAFDQQSWYADATGAATSTTYDYAGNVVKTIQYAGLITGALPARTAVQAPVAGDRVTTRLYNAFNQVTYTVDGLNRASLQTYDLAGRLASTTRYFSTLAAGATPSTTTLPGNTLYDETTGYQYDLGGHLQQITDAALGTQNMTYDGLGNKLTMTDQKNAIWNYSYDADGRLLTQTSPAASITSNSVNGNGDLVDASGDASIVTQWVYDGVGNLMQRIDAYGRPEARTTSFAFDAARHQTSVTGPAFNAYNAQGTLVSSAAPVSKAFYDAFGNVVATIDPTGAITYAAYDQANRLAYSVNQLGYVTGYSRDVFGEILAQTRYAVVTTLIGTVPTTATNAPKASDVLAAVTPNSHTSDRIQSFGYDKAGRSTSMSGMSGYFLDAASDLSGNIAETAATPTTIVQYDAFGDRVLEKQLVNQASGVYASTYHYFDVAGQETDTVDALGYLTHRTFDSFGNLSQTLEYSNAKTDTWTVTSLGSLPTIASLDRTTNTQYDLLNRKSSETRFVDWSQRDDGSFTGHTVTTSWGYDAESHVTRITDASGAITYHSYDALGRLHSTVAPSRSSTVDGSTITPLTEYAYDAFGDVTAIAQRFNTATSVSEFKGAWTSGGAKGYSYVASASDRVTRTLYDNSGRAIQIDDPMAATTALYNTHNYYTANGQLTYSTHLNTGNDGVTFTIAKAAQYDAAGQVVLSVAPTGSGSGMHAVNTGYQYNAFGEVVARGVNGGWQESFEYNNNGQLWRTNSNGGVTHVYLHDLQGDVSADLRGEGVGHADVDLAASTIHSESDAVAAGSLRFAQTVHDKLGRVVKSIAAGRNAVSGGVSVQAGTTTWSAVVAQQPHVVATVNFPDVSQLGNGELRFDVSYLSDLGPGQSTQYVTGVTSTSASVQFDMNADASVCTIQSVVISKKNTAGDWVQINPTSTNSQTAVHTQVLISAPDDPTSTVAFSYQAPGGPVVSVGLANFGDAYWFDASTLSSSVTYNYTTTITTAGGAVTTRTGTFRPAQTQAGSNTNNWITPTTLQTYDRWGNVLKQTDPRWANWFTTFQYDANNNVVQMQQTDPAGTGGAGPLTLYTYDKMGRLMTASDPRSVPGAMILNGKVYDEAGQLVHVDNADGTHSITQYDVFGRVVRTITANGYDDSGNALSGIADYTTAYSYDMADDLLSVQQGAGSGGNVKVWSTTGSTPVTLAPTQVGAQQNLVRSYTYDAEGNRLSSWDGSLAADNATHLVTYYKYDAAGHLIQTTEPLLAGQTPGTANTKTEAYDDFGHKSSETDEDGRTATWQYDYFGARLLAHQDFGGTTYGYTFDRQAQLVQQTSSRGQNMVYAYDEAGQMTQATDAPDQETTTYVYGIDGRHLQETTVLKGQVYQDNHIAYDALGRMVDSSDGLLHLSVHYDLAGNRTEVKTHFLADGAMVGGHDGGNSGNPTVDVTTDRFYAYDAMNRMTHADWTSATSAGTGHTLTYDHDGNRKTDSWLGAVVTTTQTASGTDVYGDKTYTGSGTATASSGTVVETYFYDADDRLARTERNGIMVDNRLYDGAGRVVMEGTFGALPTGFLAAVNSLSAAGKGFEKITLNTHINAYDGHGRLLMQRVLSEVGSNLSTVDNRTVMSGSLQTQGYDAAGNLLGTQTYDIMNNVTSTHQVTAFDIGEAYKAKVETDKQGANAVVTTTTTFNANDLISQITSSLTPVSPRTYVNDIGGQLLQGAGVGWGWATQLDMRDLIINGEVIGSYGLNYDSSVDRWTGVPKTDFEFGYHSIGDNTDVASVGSYTVRRGDTLQSIALSAYGDAQLWRRIADANGLQNDSDLKVGQTLTIPSSGGASHNNSGTFATYEPWKIIGANTVDPHPFRTAAAGALDTWGAPAQVPSDSRAVPGVTIVGDGEKHNINLTNGQWVTLIVPTGQTVTTTDKGLITLTNENLGHGEGSVSESFEPASLDSTLTGTESRRFQHDHGWFDATPLIGGGTPGWDLSNVEAPSESSSTFASVNPYFADPFGTESSSYEFGAGLPSVIDVMMNSSSPAASNGVVGNAAGSSYANASASGSPAAGDPQELARFGGAAAQATAPLTFGQAYAAGQAANPVASAPMNSAQPWEGSVDEAGRPIPLSSSQPIAEGTQQVEITASRGAGSTNQNAGTFAFYGQPFVTRMPVIGSDWAEKNAVYAFGPDRSQAYWYSNGQLHTIPQVFKTPTFDQLVNDPSNPFMQHAQMGAALGDFAILSGLGALGIGPGGLAIRGLTAFAADAGSIGIGGAIVVNAPAINAAGIVVADAVAMWATGSPTSPVGFVEGQLARTEADILGNVGGRSPVATLAAGADEGPFTTFFHGTTAENASKIRAGGIDLSVGNPAADFGQGFYMSTSSEDALWSASRNAGGSPTELVEFRVPNSKLDSLSSLNFGDAGAEWQDFVSFHKGLDYDAPLEWMHGGEPYDMVTGPLFRRVNGDGVPIQWPAVSPQTSIHTPTAADLFNNYVVGHP